MQIGPAGTGSLEGAVRHVRIFGPIQRAEVALCGGEGKTVIEIDAPRDRELQAGDIVGLRPRRYRIFAAQDLGPADAGAPVARHQATCPPRSPFSHGWYATTAAIWGNSMTRAIIAITRTFGAGRLRGGNTATEQPAMYVNMADPGARLDAQVAASMISQYRQNNGLAPW